MISEQYRAGAGELRLFSFVLLLLAEIPIICGAIRNRGNMERNFLDLDMNENDRDALLHVVRGPGPQEGRALDMSVHSDAVLWNELSRSTIEEDSLGLSFRVGILSIFEYVERDNITGISFGDWIIKQLDFVGGNGNSPTFAPFVQIDGVLDDENYYLFQTETESMPFINARFGISDLRGWVGGAVNATLSPDAWKWDISIRNWTFGSNSSQLALKLGIISQIPPLQVSGLLSSNEADDPLLPLSEIIVPLGEHLSEEDDRNTTYYYPPRSSGTPKSNNVSTYDSTDVGYISWTTISAVQREMNGRLLTVPVSVSDFFSLHNDFGLASNPTSIPNFGSFVCNRTWDFDEELSFVYLSFQFQNPYSIDYQIFVGIDEKDFPEADSVSSSNSHFLQQQTYLILFLTTLFLIGCY